MKNYLCISIMYVDNNNYGIMIKISSNLSLDNNNYNTIMKIIGHVELPFLIKFHVNFPKAALRRQNSKIKHLKLIIFILKHSRNIPIRLERVKTRSYNTRNRIQKPCKSEQIA